MSCFHPSVLEWQRKSLISLTVLHATLCLEPCQQQAAWQDAVNSAILHSCPLGKPFTLSAQTERGCPSVTAWSWSLIIVSVHSLHIRFLCFREHLGRFCSPFIVVFCLASDRISSPLRHNERNFQANLLLNDSSEGASNRKCLPTNLQRSLAPRWSNQYKRMSELLLWVSTLQKVIMASEGLPP